MSHSGGHDLSRRWTLTLIKRVAIIVIIAILTATLLPTLAGTLKKRTGYFKAEQPEATRAYVDYGCRSVL